MCVCAQLNCQDNVFKKFTIDFFPSKDGLIMYVSRAKCCLGRIKCGKTREGIDCGLERACQSATDG